MNSLGDPSHKASEDPINLKVVAGRGEPKEFGLIANDGDDRAFGQVVPFPIEKSIGACHVSAIMTGQNYSRVLFVVTGLQPGEEFQIDQQSGGESRQAKATAAQNGTYRAIVFPLAKGKPSGKLRFNVNAKACLAELDVPWGEGSYVIQ